MGKRKHKEISSFLGFLSISLCGVGIFVLIPFSDVVGRSFMTVMSGKWVGFKNYKTVINNEAFRLAVVNTVKFVGVAIPLLIVIGLSAALVLSKLQNVQVIKSLYLFPMAMPTATVVIVWRMFFYKQDFTSLVVSYLWKNTGYIIVLWLAGLWSIPGELTEAARVDGANGLQCFLFVKLPCLKGSLGTIVIISFLNAMKIYREAYLVAGAYPGQDIYLLQHVFNNWYVNLEFDKMAAATVLVAGVLFFIILPFLSWQKTEKV